MDSDLSLDFLRVVEQAAIACAHDDGPGRSTQVGPGGGRGDAPRDGFRCRSTAPSSSAKASATRRRCSTSARRSAMAQKSPNGQAYPQVDIAVDPLEGTNLCATGAPNALAVLAASERGGLLHAPDLYMEKLVVGPSSRDVVDLDAPVRFNLRAIAQSLGRRVEDLVVIVLDRPRHETADRRHPLHRRAHQADRRRRPVGRHHRRGCRQRRARRHGHRRRARGRAHRCGHAVSQRRDFRAARDRHARARAALPRDGHQGLQEDLSIEGSRAGQAASSSRPRESRTAR